MNTLPKCYYKNCNNIAISLKTIDCSECHRKRNNKSNPIHNPINGPKENPKRFILASEGGRAEKYQAQQKRYFSKLSNKIVRNYRGRTSAAFKMLKLNKYDIVDTSSLEVLGCSQEKLHSYLQSKVDITYRAPNTDDLALEIDHEVSFKWAKDMFEGDINMLENSMKYICNYRNLHLIPAKTNRRKGAKLLPIYEPLAALILLATLSNMDLDLFDSYANKLEKQRKRAFNQGVTL